MTTSFINEQLRKCTAQITVSESPSGFGFFVAPNTLLTCAHVLSTSAYGISEEVLDLKVHWNNLLLPAQIQEVSQKTDLALLSVELADHPYLPLNEDLVSFDILYAHGCKPLTVKGFAGDIEKIMLEGGKDDIRPGKSGTPLFNPRTEGVCGLISEGDREKRVVQAVNIKGALKFPQLASIQNSPSNSIKIFIVHSQRDEVLLNELIQSLHDTNLPKLALYWKQDLKEDFAEEDAVWGGNYPITFDVAQIIVLLVDSKYHDTSEYYRDYLPQALKRHISGEARVIQVLPSNCAPVVDWPGRSVAFRDFAKSIREIIEALNIT